MNTLSKNSRSVMLIEIRSICNEPHLWVAGRVGKNSRKASTILVSCSSSMTVAVVRFVGIPPDNVFVTIILQFVQESSEVIDESIAWVIVAAFWSSACFCWCQVIVIFLVAGGWGQMQ
jgi:hypothetical protein